MQETQSNQEDLLENGVTTHPRILAWTMNREAWQATLHEVAKNWT